MRIGSLGPDAVAARMAEIRRRIDEKLGPAPDAFEHVTAPSNLPGPIGRGSALAPMNPFAAGTEVRERAVRDLISQTAGQAGVHPGLLEALVSVESSFDPRAVSSSGAMGLAQLMPNTARALGVEDPFDPEQSLAGGARYLRQLLNQFGDVRLALAAYNAGPGAVSRFGGVPPFAETQRYVERVLSAAGARGFRP